MHRVKLRVSSQMLQVRDRPFDRIAKKGKHLGVGRQQATQEIPEMPGEELVRVQWAR